MLFKLILSTCLHLAFDNRDNFDRDKIEATTDDSFSVRKQELTLVYRGPRSGSLRDRDHALSHDSLLYSLHNQFQLYLHRFVETTAEGE